MDVVYDDFDSHLRYIASPVYYATLLVLKFALNSIIPFSTRDADASYIVNTP